MFYEGWSNRYLFLGPLYHSSLERKVLYTLFLLDKERWWTTHVKSSKRPILNTYQTHTLTFFFKTLMMRHPAALTKYVSLCKQRNALVLVWRDYGNNDLLSSWILCSLDKLCNLSFLAPPYVHNLCEKPLLG